jgi:hypothetical protein
MSTTTSRAGYVLPVGGEFCDVNVVNANMTKVDAQIGAFVCTSSTRPSSPYSGQFIHETDTGMISLWNGSAWVPVILASTSVSNTYEANASSTQSIADTAQPVIAFGTENRTSPIVARSTQGAGHRFTLNRTGTWAITCCIRWAVTSATGERYNLLNSSDGGLSSSGLALTGSSNAPYTSTLAVTRHFVSGAWVQAEAYQNSGGSRSLEFNNTAGWGRINLAWLHS